METKIICYTWAHLHTCRASYKLEFFKCRIPCLESNSYFVKGALTSRTDFFVILFKNLVFAESSMNVNLI